MLMSLAGRTLRTAAAACRRRHTVLKQRRCCLSNSNGPALVSTQRLERRSDTIKALLRTPDVQKLVLALETQPDRAYEFVLSLAPHARRSVAIKAATAESSSSAPTAAALSSAVTEADTNADGFVSRREFAHWLNKAQAGSAVEEVVTAATGAGAAAAAGNEAAGAVGLAVTRRQLGLLALNVAIPMVGFGFMDNAIMILAGDAIDNSIGVTFGLSVLASAALGNLCSDVCGIGMSDVVESAAKKLGLPSAQLSVQQLARPSVKAVGILGSTMGISIGCLLGMVPLMFIEDEYTRDARQLFAKLDTNKDGKLSQSELVKVFVELGVREPQHARAAAKSMADSLGHDGAISVDEFVHHAKLCGLTNTLLANKP